MHLHGLNSAQADSCPSTRALAGQAMLWTVPACRSHRRWSQTTEPLQGSGTQVGSFQWQQQKQWKMMTKSSPGPLCLRWLFLLNKTMLSARSDKLLSTHRCWQCPLPTSDNFKSITSSRGTTPPEVRCQAFQPSDECIHKNKYIFTFFPPLTQ